MTRTRGAALSARALLLALAVAGCGSPSTSPKANFVAVWNAAESAPLALDELSALERAGADEIFFDVAALSWESGAPELVAKLAPPLPRQMLSTLVVTGLWKRPGASPRSIARAWRTRLAELELAAERRLATPVGVHFDLEVEDGAEELAETLVRLHRELRGSLFLSVGIAAETIDSKAGRELAQAVDFVVISAYGQPVGESENAKLWDLDRRGPVIEKVALTGKPFVLTGWTLGEATLRSRDGEIRARTSNLSLPALLRDERLTLRPGAVFESLGRQVVECVATESLTLGGWKLAPGDSIRVVRPATADLETLLATAQRAGALGTVLRRLPARGETLGLGVSSLAAAMTPGEASPILQARVEAMPTLRGRRRLRVVLENQSDEPTDFGVLETNFVELRLAEGRFGAIDAGDYSAHELLWQGSERRTLRALRQPDTLRLSVRYVGGRERFESGAVEFRGARGAERVTITGRFLVPGGREIELPPARFIIE